MYYMGVGSGGSQALYNAIFLFLHLNFCIIIIRLALVTHVYSKFGMHVIITSSPVINCNRHNFLQSIKLFLAQAIGVHN